MDCSDLHFLAFPAHTTFPGRDSYFASSIISSSLGLSCSLLLVTRNPPFLASAWQSTASETAQTGPRHSFRPLNLRDPPAYLPAYQSSGHFTRPPLTLPNPKNLVWLSWSISAPKLIAESPIGFKVFPEVDQLHVFPGWLACITTLSISSTPVNPTHQPQLIACDIYEPAFYLACHDELVWRGHPVRFVILYFSRIPLNFTPLPPGWHIVTHHFSHPGTLATWILVRLQSILSFRLASTWHS